MPNKQITQLQTIRDAYLKHTDTSVEQAKILARLLHSLDNTTVLKDTYRIYLDYLTVIKYMHSTFSFPQDHGLVHLSKALTVFVHVCHKKSYGKALMQEVRTELHKSLKHMAHIAKVVHAEGKQNDKSITFPNGLSSEAQSKIYKVYENTEAISNECLKLIVTATATVEVGKRGVVPSEMSLHKWESYSPYALAAVDAHNKKSHEELLAYMNKPQKKSIFSNLGNYNTDHIAAGYNELANEPLDSSPSIFERGLAKLFKRIKK